MKKRQFADASKYRVNFNAKDDSDEEPQKEKWNTLEHHGVLFFPGYEPHGVKLLFKVSRSFVITKKGQPDRIEAGS